MKLSTGKAFDKFCSKDLPKTSSDKDVLSWYCNLCDYDMNGLTKGLRDRILKHAKAEYKRVKSMYDNYKPTTSNTNILYLG